MPTERAVEHEITVAAPAKAVYQLVADVQNWPQLFTPTVHVEHLARDERSERIRLWATANGTAKTWTSRRELDPAGLRVDFRQEVSQPPVGGMGGAWVVEPLTEETSRVRLLHDYRAATDDPADLEWIDEAVDRNSRVELAALKENAEAAGDLVFSFEDAVDVDGRAEDVFDFINQAQLWQERLPHVARVRFTEDTPGLQVLAMDTLTKDGSTHTTESIRVALPPRKIVYKQTALPALLSLHTGHWLFEDRPGGGVTATSRHTVRINEDNITAVLGEGKGVDEARAFIRNALGTNSLATLGHAKKHAEGR
ncbi:aromatase/cyclase [Actinokineospora bangkokensis]|uniref:Cyclase n=1 Tax=Actinokineospora bangkokensis TaxID=1193682 RepID=A0A1Q9LMF9_9PSEU|nr:aromatase/cyclase [Actinokineospora bangkokensis]OLR93226.1 cyclase [Actinokineospora bangkokensis]